MTLEELVKMRRAPSAAELVEVIANLGWRIAYGEDGQPRIRCQSRQDPLAQALARMLHREPYRTNVLKEATARWRLQESDQHPHNTETGREWLWRYGQTYRESPDDFTWGYADRHPAGAWWWRVVGEAEWRPIAGRCDCTPDQLGLREVSQDDARRVCSEVQGTSSSVHHRGVGSAATASESPRTDTGPALFGGQEITGRYLGGL